MASNINILQLPDLVLYKICSSIKCPVDLLHFGNTCTQLRKISMSRRIWWNLAFEWCKGYWFFIKEYPTDENPRDWVLNLLKQCSTFSSSTELRCIFSNGELWQRVESKKFRCFLGLLRWAYIKEKEDHPAILYEQWLYDIGLYCRLGPPMDFSADNFEFSENSIIELCKLGQAAERDLRRRRQPNKDPKYYVKRIANSEGQWMKDLFPSGSHGTICPLLLCPFENSDSGEVSGMQGLAVCLSIALEKRLYNQYKTYLNPVHQFCDVIKVFSTVFISEINLARNQLSTRVDSLSLKDTIMMLVTENSFNAENLDIVINLFDLTFSVKEILQDVHNLLIEYGSIDCIVDSVRMRLRVAMLDEITNVLFPAGCNCHLITRVNLTDSDLIGGDNAKQEMSAAAFISKYGVLVTWHLVGRMRF
ncbi:uncharacterized protein LOC129232517 [Uloborus diversus]|uniref:uncharacterized protein LOC129232517 n=1 Tax=Uloborus diversus TaxID=327109 RepID=UPI00240A51EC|nr:uncharacterized protein LOC129232517 [Uloborus diversus]